MGGPLTVNHEQNQRHHFRPRNCGTFITTSRNGRAGEKLWGPGSGYSCPNISYFIWLHYMQLIFVIGKWPMFMVTSFRPSQVHNQGSLLSDTTDMSFSQLPTMNSRCSAASPIACVGYLSHPSATAHICFKWWHQGWCSILHLCPSEEHLESIHNRSRPQDSSCCLFIYIYFKSCFTSIGVYTARRSIGPGLIWWHAEWRLR